MNIQAQPKKTTVRRMNPHKKRQDHVVLSEVVPLAPRRREGAKQDQRDYRKQGQQVEQNRTPAEKVFFNLEPEDCPNLPEPERPW